MASESYDDLGIPDELIEQLNAYDQRARMVDFAVEHIKLGQQVLAAMDVHNQHLKFLSLPDHLRFVLFPVGTTELYLEKKGLPLGPDLWIPLEEPEDRSVHLSWTRGHSPRQIFVGQVQQQDYRDPNKTIWILDSKRKVRAARQVGARLLKQPIGVVEMLYKPIGSE